MIVYNTDTDKVENLVILVGNSNQPIIINLNYMQDTAPNNPQEKEIWYNTSDNKIYTYKNNQWKETGEATVGVWYEYNDEYYLWDGNSLEKTDLNIYEKIANKSISIDPQTANNITYPTTKAVSDYVSTKSFVKNFTDAGITQTSGTMVQLAQDIQSKHLETGTIVYGEITCSDMPFLGNAEVRVEVLETKGAPNYYQVLEFTLFSTTDAPYQWSFMYYEPQFTTWTWVPKVIPTNDYISNTTSTVPSSKALSDGLSLKNDIYEKIKVLTESSGNYAITLEESYRCYKIVPTADFTVSFDISQLNIPANTMFSFYLLIDESAASDSWQVTQWGTGSNVQWGNTSPTMTAMVKYLFSFTTFDGGQNWVANQMFSFQ